jgi:hypothetical protein
VHEGIYPLPRQGEAAIIIMVSERSCNLELFGGGGGGWGGGVGGRGFP